MNLEEKTLSVTPIFEGKIIHVHRDIVELPNGNEAFREVVAHPGGVMVAPLLENGNLIFVKQYRYPYHQVVLELPAGKLEKGEAPYAAGLRELGEEVGATAQKVQSLGKLYPTPGYCGETIHLYVATGLTLGEQHPDEDEFLEKVEIPLDEAVEMVMRGEIMDAKTIAGVMKIKELQRRGELA